MSYNGFKNWNHWNVSLWINNTESLYRWSRELIRETGNRDKAARIMAAELKGQQTPDRAKYSISAIRAALVD